MDLHRYESWQWKERPKAKKMSAQTIGFSPAFSLALMWIKVKNGILFQQIQKRSKLIVAMFSVVAIACYLLFTGLFIGL